MAHRRPAPAVAKEVSACTEKFKGAMFWTVECFFLHVCLSVCMCVCVCECGCACVCVLGVASVGFNF